MNARTWALDMDGTLLRLPVDIEAVRDELSALFQAEGVEARFRPLLSGIDAAARAAAGGDPELEQTWKARAMARVEEAELEAAATAELCPGAAAFADALGEDPVLIITNNAAPAGRAALERCGLKPPGLVAIVGRSPGWPPKPAPDPLLIALDLLDGPPGEVICVGDRPADMAMAAAARPAVEEAGGSVRAVAVLGLLEGEGALRAAGAEAVLPDLAGVLDYLQVT